MKRFALWSALALVVVSESSVLAYRGEGAAPTETTGTTAYRGEGAAPTGVTETTGATLHRGEGAAPTGTVATSTGLKELLERDARQTRLWWWSWLGGFSALTAGQGVLYLTSDDEAFKASNLVGAAGSVLGVAGTLIHAVQPFEVKPDTDLSALLADRAAREEEGRGWLNHTLNAAVNVASGLVLWQYYDLPGEAAFTFSAGMIIGEAQIWTQPTLARDHRPGEGVTTFHWMPGKVLVRQTF